MASLAPSEVDPTPWRAKTWVSDSGEKKLAPARGRMLLVSSRFHQSSWTFVLDQQVLHVNVASKHVLALASALARITLQEGRTFGPAGSVRCGAWPDAAGNRRRSLAKIVLLLVLAILANVAYATTGQRRVVPRIGKSRVDRVTKEKRNMAERNVENNAGKFESLAGRAPDNWAAGSRTTSAGNNKGNAKGKDVNRMGLSLLGQLDTENSFVSPLSIYAALALAAAGATEGSDHLRELETVLGSRFGDRESMKGVGALLFGTRPQSSNATLDVANAVWIKDSVKQEYASTVADVFQASVQAMPSSPAPINAWCKEKTKGMIPSIIDSIDPRMVAVLTNAVYFKGMWMDKFKPESTVKKEFHTFSGPKECMMMQRTAKEMQYKLVKFDNGMKAHAVLLPYEANEFVAKLILPEGEGKDALVDLVKYLASDPREYTEHTRFFGRRHVDLSLPKFKVESFSELSHPLKSIGLPHVFGTAGGFQRMSDDPQVRMDEVLHKVSVEVTEEGTEAAAVTAIMMRTSAMVQENLTLAFDRPFLFFIEHRDSRTVLFAGRVEDPHFLGL